MRVDTAETRGNSISVTLICIGLLANTKADG
jgi:hypothetical protein